MLLFLGDIPVFSQRLLEVHVVQSRDRGKLGKVVSVWAWAERPPVGCVPLSQRPLRTPPRKVLRLLPGDCGHRNLHELRARQDWEQFPFSPLSQRC